MGNCCGKKPEKARIDPLKAPVKEDHTVSTKTNNQEQLRSKNYVPQLPRKKRVKETVKFVQSRDADGNKVLNEYMLMETIGKGSFGKVKKAQKKNDTSNSTYAIKILKKSQLKRKREFLIDKDGKRIVKNALDDVRREIAIMKKLNHENVIKLYEVIETTDGDKIYMVIDYAEGGQIIDWDENDEQWYFTKQEYEQQFNEEMLRKMLRESIKGLHYLHSHGIIHRDIKPQNLLINNSGNIMIADFGVSVIMKNSDILTSTDGTYYFMAPEVLDKDKSISGYSGKSADIWSLGITLYCFAFLNQPFMAESQADYMNVLQKQELKIPNDHKWSQDFISLLKQMLIKSADKRISIQELANNKWVNQGYEKTLGEEMSVNKLENVSEEDIRMALQLSTVVRIKTWVSKWKSDRKLSQNSKMSMEKSSGGDKDCFYPTDQQSSQNSKYLNPNKMYVGEKSKEISENNIEQAATIDQQA